MLGIYDYTVILTYLSLLSAGAGIMVTLSGKGHPYMGTFFLLFCGLCDAFDGKVARTKKNRTQMEENYGIQIDSLSDLVAFGVLPACIGVAMIRLSPFHHSARMMTWRGWVMVGFLYSILVLYILAAMIRLAYFNVTEEERKKTEGGVRKYYTGLPVTSVSLILPFVLFLQYVTPCDITPVYFMTILLVGVAFLSKFQVRKPGLRGILIMVGIGAAEFAITLVCMLLK